MYRYIYISLYMRVCVCFRAMEKLIAGSAQGSAAGGGAP